MHRPAIQGAVHAKGVIMQKTRSSFTLTIAIVAIITMAAIGAYKYLEAPGTFKAVVTGSLVLIYIVWILSEFRITAGEPSKDTSHDKGTGEAYAIGRFLTMLTAIGFESLWHGPGAWLPVGFALFFCGAGFRVYAIRTLGRCYSHRVRTPAENTIIADGPYRFLRHPAYAGMLLAHVGVLVLCFNWFLLVAFFGVFLPVLVRRIQVEESHLLAIPEYRTFAAPRARLAPGIW
jgi:protein-S-isoprenylcysteine O-methyltransferase Ste14